MNDLIVVVIVVVVLAAFVVEWAAWLHTRRIAHRDVRGWAGVSAPAWGRRLGLMGGLVAAVVACTVGSLGVGTMLAAPLFGFTLLLGVLIGELTVTRPVASARSADLVARQARLYLPARLTVAVASAGCTLLGLLTITALTGSADDVGRAGRSLTTTCPAQGVSSSAGPWPGTYYAIPLSLVIIAGFALAGVTLHRVVRRPPLSDPAERDVDNQARRRSADVIVGAVGIMVTSSLAGVCAVCVVCVSDLSGCRPAHASASICGLTLALLVSLALLAASVRLLAAPVRPVIDRPTALTR